jgi:two-component system response regulator FixJ
VEQDECFDLLARHPWGCLVLAADGATRDVLDVLTRCRRTYPEVPPLVLVKHGDIDTTVQMMKAGAADCMETPVETGRLLAAVTTLCRRAGGESRSYRAHLTRMERTVLGHILEGHTNREIAQLLCRSPRTIEVHRRHIMRKLGATNLVDLVKQMMRSEDSGAPGSANGSPGDTTASGALEIGLERSGQDR